jgi:CheY-like chemotaxis protein
VKNNAPYLVIVEDNAADSFWLKRELKKADLGLPVTLFADGQHAMEFFFGCTQLPTVVFLDLHLPGASGIKLLHMIKETTAFQKMIVFVMDGSSSPKEVAECQKLGVAGFLDKPVTVEDLQKLVAPLVRDTI